MTAEIDENVPMAASKRQRRHLDRLIMDIFGHEWCGTSMPPRDNRSMYVCDDGVYRVFSMENDGFEVGIGYPDEWHVIMRTESARYFVLWMLKIWILDWFGLRTHIWYIALHHNVKGEWKFRPYKHPKRVFKSNFEEWRAAHEGDL